MPTILIYTILALGPWLLWNLVSISQSYRRAHSTSLPVVIVPIGSFNIPWIVLNRLVPSIPQLLPRIVPFGLGDWARYAVFGWTYADARAVHNRLGPAVVLCNPGYIEVVIAEPAAAHAVLNQRRAFVKPRIIYEPFDLFGRNVNTVEGATWQRHRRLTAPSLNERISGTVWAEARRQTREWRAEWAAHGQTGMRTVSDDTAALALHVWMRAGFGIGHNFHEAGSQLPPGHAMSYKDALFTVMHHFAVLMVLPVRLLERSWMPAAFRRAASAAGEFRSYMRELLDAEKKAAMSESESSTNLLATLVRVSLEESQGKSDPKGKVGLDDDEIYGNMFVYSFAGFETTANVLATALAYLAAYPNWQDWLVHEIDTVLGSVPSSTEASFEDSFPRMKRCLAVMYETLRLNGSVVYLPKTTGADLQSITIADREHVLPPNSFVTVNVQALHLDTKVWGPDAAIWRPERWLNKTSSGAEELLEPPDGSFLPWSEGPRVCPGRKFAQVEFVAVLTTVLQTHGVTAVPEKGATATETQAKTLRMINNARLLPVTLQMCEPGLVPLALQIRPSAQGKG